MKTEQIPEYGDFYTLDEWEEATKSKYITPWDGSGYWSGNKETFWPDTNCFDLRPADAIGVVWFNK